MKAKVLIVDDDPLNRKLIKAALSREDYEISEASDGSEALEQVRIDPPDLILLDVLMPGIDGWEVTKILKNNPKTMYVPIILITALDNISDKIKGLKLGANEYLGKPINYLELRALVKSMIKLKICLNERENLCDAKDGYRPPDRPSPFPSILLVEDDEKDVKLIENYLSGESCHFKWTDNGESALEIVGGKKVDLILLDILLPNMNGFDVLKHLKLKGPRRDIPVMIMSVLGDISSKMKAIELGAYVYLTKPINKDELRVRIRNFTMGRLP